MADFTISNPRRTTDERPRGPSEKQSRSPSEETLQRFAPADNLYDAIRADVAPFGGVEFFWFERPVTSLYPFSDVDDEPNDGE